MIFRILFSSLLDHLLRNLHIGLHIDLRQNRRVCACRKLDLPHYRQSTDLVYHRQCQCQCMQPLFQFLTIMHLDLLIMDNHRLLLWHPGICGPIQLSRQSLLTCGIFKIRWWIQVQGVINFSLSLNNKYKEIISLNLLHRLCFLTLTCHRCLL